jgi:hypothetical protein
MHRSCGSDAYANVNEFSARLADFSRGSLQLLAIEE